MKHNHYIQLLFTSVVLSVAVLWPDYIAGCFGVRLTDLPTWVRVINVIYLLAATLIVLYRYGIVVRTAKLSQDSKHYPYGTAFASMMLVVIVSSVPVAILTFVLRHYILPEVGDPVSLFGLWASSLISMIFLGGMSALFSAAYVKQNPSAPIEPTPTKKSKSDSKSK